MKQTKNLAKRLTDISQIKAVDCLNMTVSQAAQGTQLSALKKHPQGEKFQVAFVTKALAETKKLVKMDADADTLVLWAQLIVKRNWYFKAEEIIKALIEGASGKHYGAIDYSQLCEWFDKYEAKKLQHNENEALKHKETFDPRQKAEPKALLLSVNELKQIGKV